MTKRPLSNGQLAALGGIGTIGATLVLGGMGFILALFWWGWFFVRARANRLGHSHMDEPSAREWAKRRRRV